MTSSRSNESKTENIVRSHFAAFGDAVRIEEQSSDSPIIQKALRAASKAGNGVGRPDFLIGLPDEPDLLIVVECKADRQKHQSANLDQYRDYAVDGVRLYASHLSRQFDVLGIAVSGMDEGDVRVSHFLHLKNQPSALDAFGSTLLSPTEYVQGYLNNPAKYKQDLESLQRFIHDMNNRLHIDRVSESNRSLLISAILIALERPTFKQSYLAEQNPRRLAEDVVRAVEVQLEQAKIEPERLKVLKQHFGFIPTETVLTTRPDVLKEIIRDIDAEVNSFIKNHKYRDVLGSLYVEFLRYANSDKGLGIVLTPPHITELFADLAQVNADSVVYDNCAGTGGFLISAMKRMIDDAKESQEIEARIKNSQLYGVELQSPIYALAVSNMYIHQDGKSNVLLGDCFDQKIIDLIKKRNPTVGFLNPPYKADKQKDIEELKFVLNNLECLTQGGICVAIVPMQCALAGKGVMGSLKEEIMQRHTLEAVLSMPDELFFNSDVGVVSCVMVFTAHRSHPANKEVFLGYFKDDGFAKQKVSGRADIYDRWEAVKQRWLDLYANRKSASGLSVRTRLKAKDEWAAEAYMETDYSQLSDRAFEKTLFEYSAHLFQNRIKSAVSHAPAVEKSSDDTALLVGNWSWFTLNQLFTVTGSKTTKKRDLELAGPGAFPYVTTQTANNGVQGMYDVSTERGGVLTVDSAVVGYCSYQELPFSASDHVEQLVPKFQMSAQVAMFLITIINMEQYRYNYGRKSSQTRLRNTRIKLPTTKSGHPYYEFMDRYIRRLPYS